MLPQEPMQAFPRRPSLGPPLGSGGEHPSNLVAADLANEADAMEILALGRKVKGKRRRRSGDAAKLEEFELVKAGIVTTEQVVQLSEIFFGCHHHYYVSIGMAELM